ncbi:hypothetical protein ACQ5RO_10250, partial [Limosilactobacillus fermentum]
AGQVMVQQSLAGLKEIEVLVMRDSSGTMMHLAMVENLDPIGIHAGSIVNSPHLNVQLKFYNLPELKRAGGFPQPFYFTLYNYLLNLFSRQFTKSACNLC